MNRRVIAISVSLLLAGCVNTGESPLIFGQANTYGLSLGGSTSDQGADLVLGYKSQNIAVVPVTVAQPSGGSIPVGAVIGGDTDAYSVLGQFESKGKTSTAKHNAGLGTFFATGLAAKRVADGFAHKLGDGRSALDADCKSESQKKAEALAAAQLKEMAVDDMIKKNLDLLAAKQAAESRLAQQVQAQQGQIDQQDRRLNRVEGQNKQAENAKSERKPNTSLLYAQYQSLGFVVSAGGAQQSADVTLGYKDRNFAVIPTMMRDADGVAVPLHSLGRGHLDGISVLGQFGFEGGKEDGSTSFGFGKFFSTGAAARRLGDGFSAKLCSEYEATKK